MALRLVDGPADAPPVPTPCVGTGQVVVGQPRRVEPPRRVPAGPGDNDLEFVALPLGLPVEVERRTSHHTEPARSR